MTREEVIKIINNNPNLTTEQGVAILERFRDCTQHLFEEADALCGSHKDIEANHVADVLFRVCFMMGYVYASLELNGEVRV